MEGGCTAGYTPNYIKVWLPGDYSGQTLDVRLTSVREGGASAELAE